MVLRRRGAASAEAVLLAEATKATDKEVFTSIYRDIGAALASYTAMTSQLDVLCGEDSPPSSTIRNTLIEAQDALRDFSNLPGWGRNWMIRWQTARVEQLAFRSTRSRALSRVITRRWRLLTAGPIGHRTCRIADKGGCICASWARIATFFREREPNSPTGYTLQTLIRRARLPLADLLQELIPDEAVRRDLSERGRHRAGDFGEVGLSGYVISGSVIKQPRPLRPDSPPEIAAAWTRETGRRTRNGKHP